MNDAFFSLLNQILVLIFLMMAGYAAKKMQFVDQDTLKAISALILKVTLPALIISSMQFPFSMELLNTSLKIILISVISYTFVIVLSKGYIKLIKAESKQRDVLQFLLVFSNVSFMGFPVIHVLYGDLGVFYTALFNIPFNILLMTLGVTIMSRSTRQSGATDYRGLFRNPGTIAVVIGFGFFLMSVTLPMPLMRSLEMIGNTTTPLSMIFIGSLLAEVPLRTMLGDRQLYLVTFVRLVLIPLMIFIPLRLLNMQGLMLGIPVIIFAMPGAVLTGAFARLYDSDYYFASKAIFFTTLCSIITIPLWTMLF